VLQIDPGSSCGDGQGVKEARDAPAARNRIAAEHFPSADQRRRRLPIRAMACGAEAWGALGGCCGLGLAQAAAVDKRRGLGSLGVRVTGTTKPPLLVGLLRLDLIRARVRF
jgi:hypothetical protein